mmetsp:Transcript_47880/g.152786  ORF Transcript_47880/g.152786 Transcript_47880/m.152786 type:complete len:319 (+) Transcript_47880:1269-2225(+)
MGGVDAHQSVDGAHKRHRQDHGDVFQQDLREHRESFARHHAGRVCAEVVERRAHGLQGAAQLRDVALGPALQRQPAREHATQHDHDRYRQWRKVHPAEVAHEGDAEGEQAKVPELEALDNLPDAEPGEAEACERDEEGGLRGHLREVGPGEATDSRNEAANQIRDASRTPGVDDAILETLALGGGLLRSPGDDAEDERERSGRVDAVRDAADVGSALLLHHAERHPRVVDVAEDHGDATTADNLSVDDLADEGLHPGRLSGRATLPRRGQHPVQRRYEADHSADDLAEQVHRAVDLAPPEGDPDSAHAPWLRCHCSGE